MHCVLKSGRDLISYKVSIRVRDSSVAVSAVAATMTAPVKKRTTLEIRVRRAASAPVAKGYIQLVSMMPEH